MGGRVRIWIVIAATAALAFPASAGAATYVVDDPDDLHDSNLGGDNVCDAAGADTCTLRAAIETAQGAGSTGNDIVQLPFDVAISLGEFSVFSNGDLDVVGTKPGGERSVIDANDSSRHFALNGVNLGLQNLTLLDGRDDPATSAAGGSIHFIPTAAGQTLELDDVRLESNDAFAAIVNGGFSTGGAIYAAGTGPNIDIADSEIVNNLAGDADDSGQGGAIYVAAQNPTLTIAGSTITGNVAKGDNVPSYGGALAVEHTSGAMSGAVTITNSAIDGNRVGGDGTTGAGQGGGIYLNGPAGLAPDLSVSGGSISSNIAGGGSGNAEGGGGAIYNLSGGPEISLTGVTLNSNRAGGNDTLADGNGQGIGGAVHMYAPLTVTNSTLSMNRAGISPTGTPQGNGGAIFAVGTGAVAISGSTFNQNLVGNQQGYGGALNVSNQGPLSITDSALTNNVASIIGGAILRGRSTVTGGDDTISRTTISGNEGTFQGGGVYLSSVGTLRVEESTVSGNGVTTNPLATGGGIWASGIGGSKATLRVTRSTVSGNTAGFSTAVQTRGGGIAAGEGGDSADVFIEESTVAGNSALSTTAAPDAFGGNIRARGAPAATLSIRGSIIADGTVTVAGSESCSVTGMATATSVGGSVEDTTPSQCGLSAGAGDIVGMDPLLTPLANNGGPTMTRGLMPGSPAVNAILNANCPVTPTDQRGFARPSIPSTLCDAGAVEVQPPALAPIGDKTVQAGKTLSFTISATDPDPFNTITYSAVGLPGGASLNAGTGAFSWTPSAADVGTHPVTFGAQDGFYIDEDAVTITVTAAPAPPAGSPAPPAAGTPVTIKCRKGFKKVRKKGKIRCKRKKRKRR